MGGSLLVTGYLVSYLFCSLPGLDVLFSRCTGTSQPLPLFVVILDFTYFYFAYTDVYVRNVYLHHLHVVEKKWASNLLELEQGGPLQE